MNGVDSLIWNDIARTQHLKTAWAKHLFSLEGLKMDEAQDQEYHDLLNKGISQEVAASYLEVKPLLLENLAITRWLVAKNRDDLRSALPEICSPNEAVILASQERHLTLLQQKQLLKLLQNPTT